ncbi:SET domain-containing protein [Apiospora kogelbergensis]|uniref:SET domain-containing protein n=1 Tax=Apiospora kogelbergensis TaxID=1337665 RepID=A0AAW0Q488_9PEZI
MDTPSIQPGVDGASHEAKTPTASGAATNFLAKKLSAGLSRSNSASSTASQRARRQQPPRPGHVIRDGQIGSFNPVEERDVPGAGRGLFATAAVARHTLLFAEEPLLFAPKGGARIGNHKVKHLTGAALDAAVADAVLALAVYGTNNVATLADDDGGDPDGEVTGGAVYPVFSRINHACDANAAFFYLGVRSQRLGVRALRDLAAGEQIFVSYIGETAAQDMTLEERRESLNSWGFECHCGACVRDMAKKAKEVEKAAEQAGK